MDAYGLLLTIIGSTGLIIESVEEKTAEDNVDDDVQIDEEEENEEEPTEEGVEEFVCYNISVDDYPDLDSDITKGGKSVSLQTIKQYVSAICHYGMMTNAVLFLIN